MFRIVITVGIQCLADSRHDGFTIIGMNVFDKK